VLLADYRPPRTVLVRDVENLIMSRPNIFSEANKIGFRSPPDGTTLIEEWKNFVAILQSHAIDVVQLKRSSELTLDALYVRDILALAPDGLIKCCMTKGSRELEVQLVSSELEEHGISVRHAIMAPGKLEGGDVIWLADNICAIGISYRTNIAGAEQLAKLLGTNVHVMRVNLPHFLGPSQILHLSSVMSVISKGVVVADVGLLPANFMTELAELRFQIIEAPECERRGLNSNILPIGSDELLIVSGNASTSFKLRSLGFRVTAMPADNLCILGDGGPTCLTRPLRFA
jgi:N-dimethylarginine dimethylaminohydrolase